MEPSNFTPELPISSSFRSEASALSPSSSSSSNPSDQSKYKLPIIKIKPSVSVNSSIIPALNKLNLTEEQKKQEEQILNTKFTELQINNKTPNKIAPLIFKIKSAPIQNSNTLPTTIESNITPSPIHSSPNKISSPLLKIKPLSPQLISPIQNNITPSSILFSPNKTISPLFKIKSISPQSMFSTQNNIIFNTPTKDNTSLASYADNNTFELFTSSHSSPTNMIYKKNLGQYFTTSNELQQFIFDKVKHKSSCLLEPAFGMGHLLKKFLEYNENYPMLCCEVDETIKPIVKFNQFQRCIYGDFTTQKIPQKFKTIIGNPPYVKQSGINLYIKFVELCYDYLEHDGELIFIVPSDFIKLTSSASIITKMSETGSFTDFLFPHNEKLFDGASIDILVFRYEKGLKNDTTMVNDKQFFCNINRGIITFSETKSSENSISIDQLFQVYVGIVSGRDEIYRVPFGNIDVLIDKDKIEKFIFIESFPSGNEQIDSHLIKNKSELLGRGIKAFSEKNWFEWGAPRNISSIRKYWGRQCIYLRNMTRQREVSFIGTVQYFGGALLCLVPKNDMTQNELKRIAQYLNSDIFKKDYIYAGRFKLGQKQASTAFLPN